MKFKDIIDLMRPFTLLYPAMAVLSGSLLAYNLSFVRMSHVYILKIISGMVIAALANAASNIFNQVYDIEIDKINKPNRPIPSGSISIKNALVIGAVITIICLLGSFFISFGFFLMVVIALTCTLFYSVPPIRLKRFHWYANLTMAIPRGFLLIFAGWAIFAPNYRTPWLFGSILFLYLLGANTAKDFSDIEGDKANGIVSIPIKYGKKTPSILKPFFIFPFLIIILYCALGWLNWIYAVLALFSIPGYKTIRLIEASPDLKQIDDNHPSWKLMYLTVASYTLLIAILSFFSKYVKIFQ